MDIRILNPASQPSGEFRILQWLEDCFANQNYSHCQFVVAFAHAIPFYKLGLQISNWKLAGKTIEAIFGIDLHGTSRQALDYALSTFDRTYIVNTRASTFHPKLYIFYGESEATVYYGSSNFTVGGLETNFEGGIILRLDLPEDKSILGQAENTFASLLPEKLSCSVKLTPEILIRLQNSKVLLDESLPRRGKANGETVCRALKNAGDNSLADVFGSYKAKPAKTIPKAMMSAKDETKKGTKALTKSLIARTTIVSGLIMQIAPHKNGEIHLSKIAVDQNPSFFGFPFSGKTTPKKASNAAYPQRVPDPIVNIEVYDNAGKLVHSESLYNLNTIYYTAKSEIRITITPSILSGLSIESSDEYPILVMSESLETSCDYDMTFYAPGSTEYITYASMCNQQLPSGGKSTSRKMGWF